MATLISITYGDSTGLLKHPLQKGIFKPISMIHKVIRMEDGLTFEIEVR